MSVFLIIFGMFFSMILLMAVGAFFNQKPITGSCGGLGSVGIEKACDCDSPCEKRISMMQKEQPIHFSKD